MHFHCFGLIVSTFAPSSVLPHLFSVAGHEKIVGQHLKWSVAFRLYNGSFSMSTASCHDQFM